jgi:hypothetical protein
VLLAAGDRAKGSGEMPPDQSTALILPSSNAARNAGITEAPPSVRTDDTHHDRRVIGRDSFIGIVGAVKLDMREVSATKRSHHRK